MLIDSVWLSLFLLVEALETYVNVLVTCPTRVYVSRYLVLVNFVLDVSSLVFVFVGLDVHDLWFL